MFAHDDDGITAFSEALAGVSYAWLVVPLLRTLEVLVLAGASWQIAPTYRDDSRARGADAIELELGLLWADVAGPGRWT